MLPALKLRLAIGIAALSGFIALSYEIVWYRVLSIMTRGTAATFGILLGAYLLGLAIGSRASARFCRASSDEPGDERGADARMLRILALFVAIANAAAALVVPTFGWSAKFTDYRIGLAVVAVGAAFLGAVLPLVSHYGIEPDDRAGPRLSYVYLSNILGSAAGSLATGFVLMDTMRLVSIARLLVVAGFLLSAGLLVASRRGGERRWRPASVATYGVLGACAAGAFFLTPRLYDRLYERLVYKNEWNGTQRFQDVVENKSGVITVGEDGMVFGSGTYDGVINTELQENDKNGIVRAYVVGAIHPAPREVLMIGLSAGAWAQVVVHVPGVEHLTVVEINPGYLDVIAKHREVSSLLDNPKIDLVIDDGRRWLNRHPHRRFDLIVMNTTMHWRAHATNLLSLEFMQLARAHLSPGGVLYFNTTNSWNVQLTAAKSFPGFKRITNFVAVSEDKGFDFDRPRWRRVLLTMRIDGQPVLDLTRAADQKLYEELCAFNDMEPAWSIIDRYEKKYRVVTDDNMVTEWQDPLRYPDLH